MTKIIHHSDTRISVYYKWIGGIIIERNYQEYPWRRRSSGIYILKPDWNYLPGSDVTCLTSLCWQSETVPN